MQPAGKRSKLQTRLLILRYPRNSTHKSTDTSSMQNRLCHALRPGLSSRDNDPSCRMIDVQAPQHRGARLNDARNIIHILRSHLGLV